MNKKIKSKKGAKKADVGSLEKARVGKRKRSLDKDNNRDRVTLYRRKKRDIRKSKTLEELPSTEELISKLDKNIHL